MSSLGDVLEEIQEKQEMDYTEDVNKGLEIAEKIVRSKLQEEAQNFQRLLEWADTGDSNE